MIKERFQTLLREIHMRMVYLTDTKGEEYARSEDQLANFKRSAKDSGVRPEQVWLIFFNKHMDAIKSYVATGKVLSEEHIDGRIEDAILYLILLKAIVEDKRMEAKLDQVSATGGADSVTAGVEFGHQK